MLASRHAFLVLAALAFLAMPSPAALAQAGLYHVEPFEATSCDHLLLRGERKFPSDCEREIVAEVRAPDGLFVDVVLTAVEQNPDECVGGPVTHSFDVELGVFPTGRYVFRVMWSDDGGVEASIGVEVIPGGCANDFGFLRGDVNADEKVDLGDPIATLNALFVDGAPLGCEEAADSNASSNIDLTDAVYSLNYLFLGGFAPPPPFPECGRPDASDLVLGCAEPQCLVELPPLPVWLAKPDGCVQCVACDAPPLDDLVADLRASGIDVLHSAEYFVPVCEACEVCSSGRFFAVLVPSSDVEALEALGWSLIDEPPTLGGL